MRATNMTHKVWIVLLSLSTAAATDCGGGFPPVSLRQPRVLVNIVNLERHLSFRHADLNLVTDLAQTQPEGDRAPALLVVGSRGACRIEDPSAEAQCVRFSLSNLTDVMAVQASGFGHVAFLAGGIWGKPAAALFGESGQLLWSYEAPPLGIVGPGIVSLADMGVDAIAMYERGKGLLLVDPSKQAIVRGLSSPRLADLVTVDLTGDGQNEILTLDEEGNLTTRAPDGSTIAATALHFNYSKLAIAAEVGVSSTLALSSPSAIHLFDSALKPFAEIQVPLERTLQIRAAAIIECGIGRRCLVSLFKGRGGWHRTVLYLHSLGGEMVYQEVLGDDYQSLLGLAGAGSEGWGFLAGGRGEVWEYRTAGGDSRTSRP